MRQWLTRHLARWTVLMLAADDGKDDRYAPLGGQAVMEGVMMRGPKTVSTAVRREDGTMAVQVKPFVSWKDRVPGGNLPLIRGIVTLTEAMYVGISSLNYSAEVLEGREEGSTSGWSTTVSLMIGLPLAVLLFMGLPATAFMYLKPHVHNLVALNLMEGGVRLALFLGYLWAISKMPEVDRLFYYHGAEHQTIFVHEDGQKPTLELARVKSPRHPRCGTSFLLVTVMISIVLFSIFGSTDSILMRILSKLALALPVAAVSYELIRMAGKAYARPEEARWWEKSAYILTMPGLWLQRLTTRPATDDQIEVAIAALDQALPQPARA